MSTAALVAEGGLLRLTGDVTIATATQLYREIQTRLADPALPAEVTLDCSAMAGADSAAIALLLEARRQAASAGKALRVSGLREQLASLAKIYGVDELLDVP